MANKWMKKLGIGMSAIMTFSQLSGMVAMAAPADDFGDFLEKKFEEQEEVQEEEDVNIIEEDVDNLEGTKDLVPPASVEWDGPGWIRFYVSDTPMSYTGKIYKDGKGGASWEFGDLSDKYANQEIRRYVGHEFRESGTYSFKVGVYESSSQGAYYSESIPEIEWVKPEQELSTPSNLHWVKTNDERIAVPKFDGVDHAYAYFIRLYEDGECISNRGMADISNEVDFSNKIEDIEAHEYCFTVEVWSNDLDNYANSQESEKSAPLTLNESTDPEEDGIAISAENFPDVNFREYVSENFDTSNDGVLNKKEIEDVENIYVNNENISSLKGIEFFYNLKKLYCSDNALTTLDVSYNTKLESLNLMTNELTDIDLSHNKNLLYLDVTNNQMNELNLSNNTELKLLYCDCVGLTNLDISKCTKLVELNCSSNCLTSIDTSNNLDLYGFSCDNNNLTSLDVSKNTHLNSLVCHNNEITELELSNNIELVLLDCWHNKIENLDVSKCTSLQDLYCDDFTVVKRSSNDISPNSNGAELRKEDGEYYCYVNGQIDNSYSGYADYDGSKFYVTNGKVDTSINGVQIDGSADPLVWYFCANGQVQTQHVGLALYDGEWFYIENGKVATDMNKFVEYDGGLFAVAAGRIVSEYSGLMQDPQDPINGDWYYFAGGQAQTQYTGLAMYDGVWFYVINGKLAVDYTGTVDYDGATFNVENGMVK